MNCINKNGCVQIMLRVNGLFFYKLIIMRLTVRVFYLGQHACRLIILHWQLR